MDDHLVADLHLTKPLAHESTALYLSLALTAERVDYATAELLKAHGLQLVQYNVLRILRGAGKTGLPCGEIGKRMIASDPDVTRIVDRLVRAGLAERERDTADRRVVRVIISAAGKRAIKPLDAKVAELHDQQFGHLSDRQRQDLRRLLDRVRHPEA